MYCGGVDSGGMPLVRNGVRDCGEIQSLHTLLRVSYHLFFFFFFFLVGDDQSGTCPCR